MKQNIRVFLSDEAAGKKRAAELIDDIYGGGSGTGDNDVDKKSYLSGFVLGYDDGLEAANNRTDEDNEEYLNAFKERN